MKRTLVLLVVVLTFLALPSFAEPFQIALNDILGIRLGMDRDALPKSLPRREIRCVLPINDRALCRLSLKDQLTFAGARLRAAELQLENDKLTAISFDLDTSAEGPVPFVSLFNQQFGKQYGATKLPQACWQNSTSSLLLIADGGGVAVVLSLNAKCADYERGIRSVRTISPLAKAEQQRPKTDSAR